MAPNASSNAPLVTQKSQLQVAPQAVAFQHQSLVSLVSFPQQQSSVLQPAQIFPCPRMQCMATARHMHLVAAFLPTEPLVIIPALLATLFATQLRQPAPMAWSQQRQSVSHRRAPSISQQILLGGIVPMSWLAMMPAVLYSATMVLCLLENSHCVPAAR